MALKAKAIPLRSLTSPTKVLWNKKKKHLWNSHMWKDWGADALYRSATNKKTQGILQMLHATLRLHNKQYNISLLLLVHWRCLCWTSEQWPRMQQWEEAWTVQTGPHPHLSKTQNVSKDVLLRDTYMLYIYRYTLTQIYHKKSSQGCVESGPTPHVTEVGLIVHTQERKVLTLSHRRKTRHCQSLKKTI